MNVNLLRIWLPISLGLHLVLIPALCFIPIASAEPAKETAYRIVHIDEPAPEPDAPKPRPVKPRLKPPKPKPKPVALMPKPANRPKPVMLKPAQPVQDVTTAKPSPVNTTQPNPGGGEPTRPRDMAKWGELKTIAQPNLPGANAPARQLAPREGPLRTPPLSGGAGSSLGAAPVDLPGIIGGPVVTSNSRTAMQLPVASIGGTHRTSNPPARIGLGPGNDRSGVPGMGGDDTPAVPNLSRVTTPIPGASAPGGGNASVFRPGLPGGPVPANGGSSLVPEREDPNVPYGLPGGTKDGKGPVVADPTIKVGKGGGGDKGPGNGPARPAHGPYAISGPKVSYPSVAQKEGNSGVVIIALNINHDGVPVKASFDKRSEADALDNAAMAAAKRWSFRPAEDGNGNRINSAAKLEFRFVLGKAPEVKQL